ncbi:MAG: vWA domain-containing protein [Phycisphaerae bacterium]
MNANNLIKTIKDIFCDSSKEYYQPPQEHFCPMDLNDSDSRNCMILIDASVSMNKKDWKPSRLIAAIKSVEAFVNRLACENPDARIAIAAYGDNAQLILDFTPAANHTDIINSLKNICFLGDTNIGDALRIASQRLMNASGNNQVILLSDGWNNTGDSPKYIADKLKMHATIEVIGIGGTPACVDEALLKHIASPYPDGTKRYRWIGDTQGLIQHFHNLAGRLERVKI